MSNPYKTPQPGRKGTNNSHARDFIGPPAIALMIVAGIAIVVGLLGIATDIWLLASGAVDQLEATNRGPVSKQTTTIIRAIWGVILVIASCYVLYGALKMKSMRNYGTAKGAAIVAVIPLLGPCCILGIPFGIWALITLVKPEVKRAFKR